MKDWWLYRRLMYFWYGVLGMPHFENWFYGLRNWGIEYKIRTYTFTVSMEYNKPHGKDCDMRCCR